MKYIFLLLALLLPGLVQAQWSLRHFETTATYGGFFEVWAETPDSTYLVSRHTRIDKAVEAQVNKNILLMNTYYDDTLFTVEVRQNLVIRSRGRYDYMMDYVEYIEIEVPGDTVYVPADTVYIPYPDTIYVEQELPLFDHVYTEVRRRDPGNLFVTSGVLRPDAIDSVQTRYTCLNQTHTYTTSPAYVYLHTLNLYCGEDDLTIDHVFYTDQEQYSQTDVFPHWVLMPDSLLRETHFTDFMTFDPDQWTSYWADNSTLTQTEESIDLVITSTGSQLWHWDVIEHTDVMEAFVTVRKQEGVNNLHIRMVADTTQRSSQDIYLGTDHILHNWWYENRWQEGNRVHFEWEPGDIVHKLVRVENDTLYTKAWHQGQSEPGWMMQEPIAIPGLIGGFGIGAHNAGTRHILNIGVATDNGPAPRSNP
jgi:hypothetical protein